MVNSGAFQVPGEQQRRNSRKGKNMQENQVNAPVAEDEEIEIDLKELFFEVKKRLWMLIVAMVLGGGIGLFVSKVVLTPTYTSTSMIYIMTKETTITSLTDLQIGAQLTKDYKVLVTSRTVMENVINNLGLNMNYQTLKGKISLDNPTDTRILYINVVDHDPRMAKTITDEVASCASDYIADIMEQAPPKIIEQGEIPQYQSSPNTKRNTLLGAVAGAVIVIGAITLATIMNDAVKTEDDITRYFGVPVLAVVPERSGSAAKKMKKQASAKKRKGAAV